MLRYPWNSVLGSLLTLFSTLLSLVGYRTYYLLGNDNFQQTSYCFNMFRRNRLIPKCIATFFALHVDCRDDIWIWLWIFYNHSSNEHRHVIAIFYRLCISLQDKCEPLTAIFSCSCFIQIEKETGYQITNSLKSV